MLTGVHSARSGVYYNTQAYRRSGTWIADVQTLPASFQKMGYLTAGYGKVTHNRFAADDLTDYTPGYYKMFDRKTDVKYTDPKLVEKAVPGSVREIPGNSSKNWTWGTLPDDWDRADPTKMQQDTEQANRTIGFLGAKHDQPFFLACGFWRPHARWSVPQRYYDMFPLKDIQLPRGYRADDLEDLPGPGRWIAMHRREHADVLSGAMWREALRGYLASVAYVDEQIGRVLDALERSDYRDNTIVVFLSDNGMHLGEKDHWLKFALWEQTCRVFLSISVPGMPLQRLATPVSLIDLYPTLLNLSGVTPPGHSLDGVDLSKILSGESKARASRCCQLMGPAITRSGMIVTVTSGTGTGTRNSTITPTIRMSGRTLPATRRSPGSSASSRVGCRRRILRGSRRRRSETIPGGRMRPTNEGGPRSPCPGGNRWEFLPAGALDSRATMPQVRRI